MRFIVALSLPSAAVVACLAACSASPTTRASQPTSEGSSSTALSAPSADAAAAANATPSAAPVADGPLPEFPPPGPPPKPAPVSVRDAKIMKLAKASLACKPPAGGEQPECPAMKAWDDEEKAFEGKGNVTLLSLLEDPDVKLRRLTTSRSFEKPEEFFADKENARRLLAVALKENDSDTAHSLGGLVTRVDAEKLGLKSEFFALTKHPDKRFREALGFYLLGRNPSAFNLIVAERLMNDPDQRVQELAAGSLSTGGITKGTDAVCKLLTKQLGRTDRTGARVHWDAGTSNCKSVFPMLVDSLEKRVAAMKEGDREASSYALAASAACKPRPEFDEATLASMRKRLFAVGVQLTSPKRKDVNDRNFGISVLTNCDPKAARPILEAMTKEKDSFIVDRAKDALKGL